jgi:protein TonB
MTFRHSFYISIAAHMMVFGSAFAIAQYAGGRLLSFGDVMMVALTSPGQTSGAGGKGFARQGEDPATSVAKKSEVKEKELTTNTSTAPEALPAPPSEDVRQGGKDGKNNHGNAQFASRGGQGVSTEPGGGMPGEWSLLAEAIERAKQYPRMARERGIEGVVWLRVKLAPSGAVEKIEIAESSGSEILDKAAIETVYRATATTAAPYVSDDWVKFPMRYVLK